jgi:hypothetical protein
VEFSYRINDEDHLVEVELRGPITLEGMLALHHSLLGDPGWRGGCRMIYDLSNVPAEVPPYDDLMALVQEYGHTPPERRAGPVALVATDNATFGTLRMLRGQLDAIPREVQMFRETAAARAWLGLPPVPAEDPQES